MKHTIYYVIQQVKHYPNDIIMEDEQKNLRIIVYYSLETLNQIKSKIDKRTLSRVLTNNPFDQFLNIKMTKIPTQFLNFLLRKQCHTKKN